MEKITADPSGKDPHLWEIAKKRASFKGSLITYFVVNAFLWALWFFTGDKNERIPWPVWPTLGWGVGMIFYYLDAYVFSGANSAEREYEKLKKRNQNKY